MSTNITKENVSVMQRVPFDKQRTQKEQIYKKKIKNITNNIKK